MRTPVIMSSRRLGGFLLSTQPLGRRWQSTAPRKTIAQFLDWKPEAEVNDVVLNGYIRSVRNMKTERFLNVGDGSSRTPIQALVSRTHDERWALALLSLASVSAVLIIDNIPAQTCESVLQSAYEARGCPPRRKVRATS